MPLFGDTLVVAVASLCLFESMVVRARDTKITNKHHSQSLKLMRQKVDNMSLHISLLKVVSPTGQHRSRHYCSKGLTVGSQQSHSNSLPVRQSDKSNKNIVRRLEQQKQKLRTAQPYVN